MRAATQIEPLTLLIYLEVLALGDSVDKLDLEHLAVLFEELPRLLAAPHFLGEGRVLLDDLVHPLFDPCQIVGMERLLLGKIVIEAVLDHRSYGDLNLRPQRLHGLSHHVRAIVPDELDGLRVRTGDDLDFGVGVYWIGEIGKLAIK